MPEVTPQQIDQHLTNQAIANALNRQMKFDRPLLAIKAKPRKQRSDKVPVVMLASSEPPLTAPVLRGTVSP
jgi:hypothetical protein